MNDFHGNLEPLRRPFIRKQADGGVEKIPVGSAAALAAAVASHRAQDEYSLVISAGDLISASPLVSSLFLDEPSIGAMNRLGLDFNAVGNHEFDRGWRELLRMQSGGCEQHGLREPCQVEQFGGADFRFLAANVTHDDTKETLFPATGIRRFGSGQGEVSVGVIGLTLKDTPSLVTPSGVEGISFGDEAEAINAQVPNLIEQGADVIVVAIHQGLYSQKAYDSADCEGISGPLLAILNRLDPRVNLVISGHTHQAYVCDYATIDPTRKMLVSSAGYGGSLLTDIAVTVDPDSNKVRSYQGRNVLVRADGAKRADVAAYVSTYSDAAQAAASRPVGKVSGDTRDPGPATEETPLGNFIADAQLFATRDAGAQIALMNNSGIRTSLTPQADGTISFGDIYAVQPFGNRLITKSFTGAQLLALLEQQVDDVGFAQTFSVSQGFAFTYDVSRPSGRRVIRASLDGEAIDPQAIYRITMNSFLADGGDKFTVFSEGADATTGPNDLDAMEEYLQQRDIWPMPATGRVSEQSARQ